jgi:hypothetical protein
LRIARQEHDNLFPEASQFLPLSSATSARSFARNNARETAARRIAAMFAINVTHLCVRCAKYKQTQHRGAANVRRTVFDFLI